MFLDICNLVVDDLCYKNMLIFFGEGVVVFGFYIFLRWCFLVGSKIKFLSIVSMLISGGNRVRDLMVWLNFNLCDNYILCI